MQEERGREEGKRREREAAVGAGWGTQKETGAQRQRPQ